MKAAEVTLLPFSNFFLGLFGVSLDAKLDSAGTMQPMRPWLNFPNWASSWLSSAIIWLDKDSLVQFSCSVMSNSLWPHGLQHTRPPCPSPTPRVYSNSCPLSRWCHPTISSSVIPFSRLQSFPGVFSDESVLRIRWPKYWSFNFSIRPSSEYSGLISFRVSWLEHSVKCSLGISNILKEISSFSKVSELQYQSL